MYSNASHDQRLGHTLRQSPLMDTFQRVSVAPSTTCSRRHSNEMSSDAVHLWSCVFPELAIRSDNEPGTNIQILHWSIPSASSTLTSQFRSATSAVSPFTWTHQLSRIQDHQCGLKEQTRQYPFLGHVSPGPCIQKAARYRILSDIWPHAGLERRVQLILLHRHLYVIKYRMPTEHSTISIKSSVSIAFMMSTNFAIALRSGIAIDFML